MRSDFSLKTNKKIQGSPIKTIKSHDSILVPTPTICRLIMILSREFDSCENQNLYSDFCTRSGKKA